MTAPTVSPRETRRPEFPATVHAYTDVLRELVDGPHSAEALAQATDRVPSNVRRDAQKLRDAGVIEMVGAGEGLKWRLTDKGRRWVTGIDVAEGKAAAGSGELTATLDRLVPDPDQPRKAFDPAELAELADSIADKGLLQPILVRAADDEGRHMIIAGERRYRAIAQLIADGRWPADLGVPIRLGSPEDEAEAMELALVENTQRTDLNHMELALGYQRLFDLGRTPKQIGAVVGRTSDHVTQHLRLTRLEAEDQAAVAAGALPLHQALEKLREASKPPVEWTTHDVWKTPFGANDGDVEPLLTIHILTDGERYKAATRASLGGPIQTSETGSGDDPDYALRAGILHMRTLDDLPRPAIEWLDRLQGPHVVNGVDHYNAARAQEARYAIGWDKRQANHGGGPASLAPRPSTLDPGAQAASDRVASDSATHQPEPLSPRARLALVELAHKVAAERRPLAPADDPAWTGDREADHAAFGASVGTFWLDGAHGELVAARLAGFAHVRGGLPPIASLTPAGVAFLIDAAIDLPVDDRALERAQLASGQGIDINVTYETPWLEQVAQPHDDGGQAASDSAPSHADPWGRSAEQVAADEALDAQVAQLALGAAIVDVSALFADFGVASAETCDATDDDIGVIYLRGADGTVVTSLTVDAPGELPTSRVRAIADLVAHHLTAVLG